MAQKSPLRQMNRLPNHRKCKNSEYFGQNIDYQIGISAKAINIPISCNRTLTQRFTIIQENNRHIGRFFEHSLFT
jgi:hypothetical protein